nr:MAG TPA: hypothetical protein [Microviridae sp.]
MTNTLISAEPHTTLAEWVQSERLSGNRTRAASLSD